MGIRYTNPNQTFTFTVDNADMNWELLRELVYGRGPATTNAYHRDPNIVEGSVVSVRDADDEEGV